MLTDRPEMVYRSTDTGEEEGDLNREAFSLEIAFDQDRNQDCRAEHRKHMLKSEDRHPALSQLHRIINGFLLRDLHIMLSF